MCVWSIAYLELSLSDPKQVRARILEGFFEGFEDNSSQEECTFVLLG